LSDASGLEDPCPRRGHDRGGCGIRRYPGPLLLVDKTPGTLGPLHVRKVGRSCDDLCAARVPSQFCSHRDCRTAHERPTLCADWRTLDHWSYLLRSRARNCARSNDMPLFETAYSLLRSRHLRCLFTRWAATENSFTPRPCQTRCDRDADLKAARKRSSSSPCRTRFCLQLQLRSSGRSSSCSRRCGPCASQYQFPVACRG
jgi:hypothetical protein